MINRERQGAVGRGREYAPERRALSALCREKDRET